MVLGITPSTKFVYSLRRKRPPLFLYPNIITQHIQNTQKTQFTQHIIIRITPEKERGKTMIKQRKKIAAMLVASMILVTSLPNTAEAFSK